MVEEKNKQENQERTAKAKDRTIANNAGQGNEIVLEGKNIILGRLCSFAAKQALLGKNIVIVNCNDVLVSGNRENILREYSRIRKLDTLNLRGPILPKVPEKIVKRTVRGMLSYKQARGYEAWKRVMCYNSLPTKYESAKKLVLKESSLENKNVKTMALKEVARLI
ncbi:50S ribosomal protein L13 [Candidatus Pacearchaeota archaeon]|nr:50S ribosomal protein L13 [Candidatus Pacearchaeota archaeon]